MVMAVASLLFGFLSIVGFIVALIGDVEPVLIYWLSGLLALAAVLLGFIRRREKPGQTGMWLGLVGLVMGVAMALW
jgi:uncharacterized membrane protein YwaF